MKKLLLFIALIILISCEKNPDEQCWLCSVETGKREYVWNDWYQRYDEKIVWSFAGMEKHCSKKPKDSYMKRYDCEKL